MLNRRERKLLKNKRKKNNERLTWNFVGWTVWAENGSIEWCTACDEGRNSSTPPPSGWQKNSRGKEGQNWNERYFVTEESLNTQGDRASKRGRKKDKRWMNGPKFCADLGESHVIKTWLQIIAVLTVNVRSTYISMYILHISEITLSLSADFFWKLFSPKIMPFKLILVGL